MYRINYINPVVMLYIICRKVQPTMKSIGYNMYALMHWSYIRYIYIYTCVYIYIHNYRYISMSLEVEVHAHWWAAAPKYK